MNLLLKSGSKPELIDYFVYKNNGLGKAMLGLRERIVILVLCWHSISKGIKQNTLLFVQIIVSDQYTLIEQSNILNIKL